MNPLAELVMQNEAARRHDAHVSGGRKGYLRRTRQAAVIRERSGACSKSPWNRMDVRLKLHLCDSVKVMLRELAERDERSQ